MNAITLLRQDHGNVEELFRRFEELGDGDHAAKANLRDNILEQLAVHAAIEEEAFYPAIRSRVPSVEADVLEALEEHHLVKLALNELEKLAPAHERFDAKMKILIENVRHHVEEEEGEGGLFDQVRNEFTVEELENIGESMEKLKAVSPKRAHPFIPDVPPFNLILGPGIAVLDKAINLGKGAVGALLKKAS